MDDGSDSSDRDDVRSAGPGNGEAAGTPRWVKVFGIIVVVVVLLFVVLMLTRGGHGPRRHLSLASAGDCVPATGLTAQPARASASSQGTWGPGRGV